MFGVGLAAVLMRRRRLTNIPDQPIADPPPSTFAKATLKRPARFFSYSLRTLLVFTTVIAITCFVGLRWTHIAILLVSLLLAIVVTIATVRFRRKTRRNTQHWYRTVGFGSYALVTGVAWVCFYVLSAGPVFGLLDWLDAPQDVEMAVILTIYRPFVWVEYAPFRDHGLLEWYFDQWGIS
jgi:hypothetical protein